MLKLETKLYFWLHATREMKLASVIIVMQTRMRRIVNKPSVDGRNAYCITFIFSFDR